MNNPLTRIISRLLDAWFTKHPPLTRFTLTRELEILLSSAKPGDAFWINDAKKQVNHATFGPNGEMSIEGTGYAIWVESDKTWSIAQKHHHRFFGNYYLGVPFTSAPIIRISKPQ